MDNAPGVRFVSLTFLVGFGLGAFIGVALALIAVAIARPEDEEPQVIQVPVIASTTPLPDDTPRPAVRATAALAVRVGPGDQFATLGTISRGDVLDVVGRDFDSEWLAIRFPRGSNAQGWVPAADVEGLTFSNVEALAVLLPTPLPIEFATPPLFFGTPGVLGSGTPGVEAGTPDPLAGTLDMAVFEFHALSDGRVHVVVLNGGPEDLTDELLIVTVRGLGLATETLSYAGVLRAGGTLTFTTSSFTIGEGPEQVQVLVDPSSSLNDPNRSNNVATGTLSRTPDVTPTPPPAGSN